MITNPTLILDAEKCRSNIDMMARKAKLHNLVFRPHFKTHQSLEIGRLFRDAGVDKITVSSLEMAEYFSTEWNDITVAFPVNILEISTINRIAEKICLNLLVESSETLRYLQQHVCFELGIFIKIDVGYHRTGLSPDAIPEMDQILRIIDESSHLSFKGFLTHAGHTYSCRSREAILDIHQKTREILLGLKSHYLNRYPDLILSIGDTPSCSIADDFSGIDEIRPGNFVFYDLMQLQIGSCSPDQIAVAMACPVVAVHPDRNELVIYGGSVHFSKERLEDEQDGTIYGRVAAFENGKWGEPIPGMHVKGLSQEHGIVSVPEIMKANFKPGDILYVLPVHSCLTRHASRVTRHASLIDDSIHPQ